MESLPQVEAGVVGLHKSSRLVAFVVPKIYTRTMSSEHSSNQEQHMHSSTNDTANSHVSSRAVEMEVLKGLSQLVPSHSVPDSLLLIPALPLTNHGTMFYSPPVCITISFYWSMHHGKKPSRVEAHFVVTSYGFALLFQWRWRTLAQKSRSYLSGIV